jgi:superfamily II DNA or RNA helicase
MNTYGCVNQGGLFFPVKVLSRLLGDKNYFALLKKLTCTYVPKIGPPVTAKMYKVHDRDGTAWVRLPRAVCDGLGAICKIDADFSMVPLGFNPPLQLDLFQNQILCIERLMQIYTPERIANGSACAELVLRAGMGKTFVAAGLISRLGLRTLYIVPKDVLMKQACDDLRGCFDSLDRVDAALRSLVVGPFGRLKKSDPRTIVERQDVTVIVIDSAMRQDAEFFAKYSFLICDEVHTLCSSERRKVFEKCHCAVMLGMTATPNQRSDKMDPIVQKEFICARDGLIDAEKLPGYVQDDVNFATRVTIVRYLGPPEYTRTLKHEATDNVFCSYMHRQFLSDPYRLFIAVQAVRTLYEWRGSSNQKHCIYIFCEELELLQILYRAFRDTFGDAITAPEIGNEVGNFVGGIKAEVVDDIKDNARILLTTYGYGGTGVSILKMTAIVKLTPRRANMQQIDARILRRGGDESIERRIIDIQDYNTCLRGQLSSRMQSYEHYKMEIEIKKVKWHDIAGAMGGAAPPAHDESDVEYNGEIVE